MRCSYRNKGDRRVSYIEPDIGLERTGFLSEPQPAKDCEDCIYFDRDLAADQPCGLCYESTDRPNWRDTDGDAESGEMEYPSERVCTACSE